jgi:peptidoglycan/LPS O-acetylase OafA/YrhL
VSAFPQEKFFYIGGFDILRTTAVIAVVGIHSFFPDPHLASLVRNLSFAIPCFVLIAVYLSARQINGSPSVPFLKKRLLRLVPGFFVWTAIYFIARSIDGNIANISLQTVAEYIFLGSAALHLYFVPMIFYYSILLIIMPRPTGIRLGICFTGLFIALWLRSTGVTSLHFGNPEADAFPFYFIYNLPYLFIGILIFDLTERTPCFLNAPSRSRFITAVFGCGSLLFWILPTIFPVLVPEQEVARNVFLFLTFLSWPFDIPMWINNIASVTFGIYLSHHLIVEGLLRVEGFLQFNSDATNITITRFIVATVLAIALCMWLRKSRQTIWLVR